MAKPDHWWPNDRERPTCFWCSDDTNKVFSDGFCSWQCRQNGQRLIVGLGLSIARFCRRERVAELSEAIERLCDDVAYGGYIAASVRYRAEEALSELAAMAVEGER
jgi:hypothetical protein